MPESHLVQPGAELRHTLHQRLALAALGCGLPVLIILWALEVARPAAKPELMGLYAVAALLCLWATERVLKRKSLDGSLKIIVAFNLVFIGLQAYVGGAGQAQFSMLLMLIANAVLGYLLFLAREAGLLSLGGFGLAVGAGAFSPAFEGEPHAFLSSAQLYLSTGTVLVLLHALAWYKVRFVTQSYEQMRLEHEAHTDALTGLPNRRRLYQQIEELLAPAHPAAGGSVLLLDIDHFKRVNDQHGHLAGDSVLAHLARVIQASAQPGETPGRWGGEEFMLILPGIPEAGAARRAEQLRQALLASPHPQAGPVTASFGVSVCRAGDDLARLVARVDNALYGAKASGRNRVQVAPGPDL